MFDENYGLRIDEAKAKAVGLSMKIANCRTLYDLKMAMPFQIKPPKPSLYGHLPDEQEEMHKELKKWLEEVRTKILGPYKKDFNPLIAPLVEAFKRKFEELEQREKLPGDDNATKS